MGGNTLSVYSLFSRINRTERRHTLGYLLAAGWRWPVPGAQDDSRGFKVSIWMS